MTETFDIDEGFGFFTASTNNSGDKEIDGAATSTPMESCGGGFDIDFGDWGLATHDVPATDEEITSGDQQEGNQHGGDGFDFSWDDPVAPIPHASDHPLHAPTAADEGAPSNHMPQCMETQVGPTPCVAPVARDATCSSVAPEHQHGSGHPSFAEPPAKKHRGEMPPPSPMPPRQSEKPVLLNPSRSSSQPQLGAPPAQVAKTAPAPRKQQAAIATMQSQGISQKAVQDLLSEVDQALRDATVASTPTRMTDAAFRSSIAAAKQRAESEAQLLANCTANLLKVAVSHLDRLGPNPSIASLVGGQHLFAATPVVHLMDALKERLAEKIRVASH